MAVPAWAGAQRAAGRARPVRAWVSGYVMSGNVSSRAASRRRAKQARASHFATSHTASSRAASRRRAKQNLAFTLIELLAVLLIMALIAGLTLPNLSLRSERVVLGEAQDLAASFAFARQRAIATAVPHRVVVDLDRVAYWIEEGLEVSDPSAGQPAPANGGARAIQLVAPATGIEFQALPGPFGRPRVLRDPVFFDSVETLAAGAVHEGQAEIVFDGDGTADPALLVLANADGDVYVLHLLRLADEVRISRE